MIKNYYWAFVGSTINVIATHDSNKIDKYLGATQIDASTSFYWFPNCYPDNNARSDFEHWQGEISPPNHVNTYLGTSSSRTEPKTMKYTLAIQL